MTILSYIERRRITVAKRRRKVANLKMQSNLTHDEIGQAVGVAGITVKRDLKAIELQWREEAVKDIGKVTAEQIAKIDAVELHAWTQWRESVGTQKDGQRQPRERTRVTTKSELKQDGTKIETETDKMVETLLPESKYLDIIQKCIEQRCRILGVKPPDVLDIGPNMADAIQRIYERRKQRLETDSKDEESEDT